MKHFARLVLVLALAGCESTAPSTSPLELRVVYPAANDTIYELDTVYFVAEASAKDIGLLPPDSLWWEDNIGVLGSVVIGNGPVLPRLIGTGPHAYSFHARYGDREDSVAVPVVVRGAVGRILWGVPLDSAYDEISLGPTGVIYASGRNYAQAVAISPGGQVLWRTDFGGSFTIPPPAIGPDGTLYYNSWSGVEAITPDGRSKWLFRITDYGPPGSLDYHVHGSVAVGADGTIYLESEESDAPFYAINLDGSFKWRASTRTTEVNTIRFTGPVTLIGDSLVVSLRRELGDQREMHLIAVTTDSGVMRWRTRIGNWTNEIPGVALGNDGTVYMASYGQYPYLGLGAFTPAGDTIWIANPICHMRSGSATVRGGLLYLGNEFGGIRVYDATTGNPLVSFGTLSPDCGGTVTIGRNGVLYSVGTDTLFSYTAGGVRRFAVQIPHVSWSNAGPVIGADGTVYVRANRFGVLAINDTMGPDPTADWPTYQGGMSRQGRR